MLESQLVLALLFRQQTLQFNTTTKTEKSGKVFAIPGYGSNVPIRARNQDRSTPKLTGQIRHELEPLPIARIWVRAQACRAIPRTKSLQPRVGIETDRLDALPLQVPGRQDPSLERAGNDGLGPVQF